MMIDITNEILTKLKSELDGVSVLSTYQSTTNNFPTVTIEEVDNSVYTPSKDSAGYQHSNLAFMIEIYTNGSRRMSDAKLLRSKIDNIMSKDYGMARGRPIVIPNYLDSSVYRYRLTYTGLIDKNKKIYRG